MFRELAEAHAAVDCLRLESAAAAEADAAHAAHVERMAQELARCAAAPELLGRGGLCRAAARCRMVMTSGSYWVRQRAALVQKLKDECVRVRRG